MSEFLASAYFLGILMMSGACVLFLAVFLPSWYDGYPRRFWLTHLTYDNKDQQSCVRTLWLFAWIIAVIGSLLVAGNVDNQPVTFWQGLIQTLYNIFMIWLVAKAIVALCILGQYIGLGFIRLKQWIFNDKPLFPKHQKIKPLER